MNDNKVATPFFVWVGGKTRNIKQYQSLYPKELKTKNIKRYIECFLGSGAVFFNIKQKYKVDDFILIDINSSLVNAFIQLRDNVDNLIIGLSRLQDNYNRLNSLEKKNLYYNIRDLFNTNNNFDVIKATQFIFLTKTVFNACIRYNSKGKMNAPFGFKDKINLCNCENLLKVSGLLENTIIKCGDYKMCKDYINPYTFVYFDPPYRPVGKSEFVRYNAEVFNDYKQLELRDFFKCVCNDKTFCMLSNSYSEDGFFQKLYEDYNFYITQRKSCVAGDASYRKPIKEFLITNYLCGE